MDPPTQTSKHHRLPENTGSTSPGRRGPGGAGEAEIPGSWDEPTSNAPFHPVRQEGNPLRLMDREQGMEGCGDEQVFQGRKMQAPRGAKVRGQRMTAGNVTPGPACQEP